MERAIIKSEDGKQYFFYAENIFGKQMLKESGLLIGIWKYPADVILAGKIAFSVIAFSVETGKNWRDFICLNYHL